MKKMGIHTVFAVLCLTGVLGKIATGHLNNLHRVYTKEQVHRSLNSFSFPSPDSFPTFMCGCLDITYVTVAGSPGPAGDDQTLTVPLPFTFTWAGNSYTDVSICTNGFIVMGSSTYSSFDNNLCLTAPSNAMPMITPFWDDLNTFVSGNIVYATLGSPPYRTFVVQWTDVGFFGGGGRVTMQIRLYETFNRVEFHYGPGVNGASSGSVGFNRIPGGPGNILSVSPNFNCSNTTTSTTSCNNAIVYTTSIFPSGRKYQFYCPALGIDPFAKTIPTEFLLYQNYPNPFNPSTKIKFDIPLVETHRNASLRIYDILGREIQTLVNEHLKPGTYETEWDAWNFPSGVYYYTLQSGDFSETKKMLLIK